MKTSQTYRPVLVATHTIDSAAQAPKSALRGRMQRLGLTLFACALVIGVIGSASAGQAQDEAAVRALGDNLLRLSFRRMPNSEHPYSPKMELS
jgi:hypothetical protein